MNELDRILPPLLLALTAVTGLVDAVSYLGLGHVFTANMTGNVVFLGFAIAGAPGLSIARSGAALVAFVIGALIGGSLATRLGEGKRHRWTSLACTIEAALLLAAAAVSLGAAGDLVADPPRLYGIIALTGLAMGVRNAVVRRLSVRDLTTTVLTLTLTGIAADSSLAGGTNPGGTRRLLSVVLMFAGAAVGAWLLRRSLAAPLALGAAVAAAGAIRSHLAGAKA
jgi:uncharacterized membrane protein YoaK (UPF0700 family)